MNYLKQVYTNIYLKKKYKSSHISLSSKCNKNIICDGKNRIYFNSYLDNVKLGYGTYIGQECMLQHISFGKYCSISDHLFTVVGEHPSNTFVSTHPAFYSTLAQAGFTYVDDQKFEEFKYAKGEKSYMISVGNDVWIGSGVRLLMGISIGDGAIIATGAVVTKSIPPYAVVGGVPAKIIKYRFSDEDIDFLERFKWWDKDEMWIKNNIELFTDLQVFKKNINSEKFLDKEK